MYFFHLRNGVDVLLDPDGRQIERNSIAAAALAEARAIVAADAGSGTIDLDQKIEVQDSNGKIVHRIEFEDAVRVVHGTAAAL
jgi:hypothetical protein